MDLSHLLPKIGDVLRGRLLQFLVIGGLIFAASRPVSDPARIEIDERGLRGFEAERAAVYGAPLTDDQRREVRERAIEDELLAREARRLGFDQGDELVRQRLVQKMLFLAEDMGGASRTPTEDDLRQYFAAHRELYTEPPRVRFLHVFARERGHAEELQAPLRSAVARGLGADEVPDLGDPFLLPRSAVLTEADITNLYGGEFSKQLRKLPVSSWSGPIASKYGFHLAKVIERVPGHAASYEEARRSLPLDLLIAKREDAVERYLRLVFTRYQVFVGRERVLALEPIRRTAAHSQSSGED